MTDTAEIGVFGGSGFYSLLDDVREVKVDTPYGAPSDSVFLAEVGGQVRGVPAAPWAAPHDPAAPDQLPRQRLGDARRWASRPSSRPCAAGSLQAHVKPGDFVVCDQFVDRTRGRGRTPSSTARSCRTSRRQRHLRPGAPGVASDVIREHGIPLHESGTVVVIEGPRFSTKSESKWFSDAGWEVINMTQYPEAYLCRELGMAVVNISLITDYDAGVLEGTEAVDARSVLEVFQENAARIQKVVLDMIGRFPADLDSSGATASLEHTRGDGHAVIARGHPLVRDGLVGGGVRTRTCRAPTCLTPNVMTMLSSGRITAASRVMTAFASSR